MAMSGVEQDAIIDKLDQLIRQAAPGVVLVPKYGGTLYTLKPEEKEGQFCGVFPYKAHVQLAFSNGTALDDPEKLLTGTGKFRRHINFSNPEEVEPDALVDLLRKAVAHSLAQGT